MKLLKAFTLTSMVVAGGKGQAKTDDVGEPEERNRRFLVSWKNKRIIFLFAKLLVTLI